MTYRFGMRRALLAGTAFFLAGCTEQAADDNALGEQLYQANCAACHGADGMGVAGEHPPLKDSDWLEGDERRLISVVLNGLSGPILVNDEPWDGQMPGFPQLGDSEVAALLNYVRATFHKDRLAPIDAAAVAEVREHTERYGVTGTIAAREGPREREYKDYPEGYLDLAGLQLPPGFNIEVYAKVNDARSLALGDGGTVFVGNNRHGEEVYALVDRDRDNQAERVHTIASGLVRPNGVAFRDGALYVAEITRILKFPNIERNLAAPPKPEVVFDGFPNQTKHEKKFMKFGPDGKLYVPVGADCNVCPPKNDMDGTIVRMKPDGSDLEVIARGVRNSVGMDWHPQTGKLWFTDNGRDLMGDDIPACEINRLDRIGQHFGFPACHARSVVHPEFGDARACTRSTPPVHEVTAHASPLGMIFYNGKMFPPRYRGALFVAEHGSWNRDGKVGYQVSMAQVRDGKVVSYTPFVSGWLDAKRDAYWGRPVDLLQMPDGALLLSDDWANVVYRISYEG